MDLAAPHEKVRCRELGNVHPQRVDPLVEAYISTRWPRSHSYEQMDVDAPDFATPKESKAPLSQSPLTGRETSESLHEYTRSDAEGYSKDSGKSKSSQAVLSP
ncbi:unnamed protein product [Cochlearia groenlandica]